MVEALAALPRPAIAGLRWTGPPRWHVTLRFLGTTEVAPVRAAVGRVVAPTTNAVMGPTTERFGGRVLYVPVAGLDGLAAAVGAGTAELGRPPDDRPFRGHITLARARGRGMDLRPYCGQALMGGWPVTEITLVMSDLGGREPRYHIVERIELGRG